MLKVETSKWNQTPSDLLDQSIKASHPRIRERFAALYMITEGSCATQVALKIGRLPQTVMVWVQKYNMYGPESLNYKRSGGRPPLFARTSPRLSSRKWKNPPIEEYSMPKMVGGSNQGGR